MSEFYVIFARKMPEFYETIAQKIFSRVLVGHVPPLPPVVGLSNACVSNTIASTQTFTLMKQL